MQKDLKKYKDKDDFAEQLKRELFYYFGSKYEWEVIITTWTTHITMTELDRLNIEKEERIKKYGREPYSMNVNPTVAKKIDVRSQVLINFDMFLDYVWSNKKNL